MASVRSLLSFYSLVALSALTGCSDPQESSLKTLDAFSSNLTNSELRCSARGVTLATIESHSYWRFKHKILPATDLSETQKDAFVKQTIVALTAVPEPLVELFFASGDLRITPEASTICASHTSKDESKGYAGCVVALTTDGTMSHSIIADASDYGVSGTVVRSFGYWISQNLSGLYAAAGKTYSLDANSTDFLKHQRQITDLYFRDVFKVNRFDISHFDSFFGEKGTEKVRYNVLLTKNEALAGVTFNTKKEDATRLKKRRQFESFVFAESFDSFHCNDHTPGATNTNKAFLHFFPKTHAKFASVITAVAAEVAGYLETKQKKPALSFSLFDAANGSGSPDVPTTSATVVAEPIVTGNPQPATTVASPSSTPATTPSSATASTPATNSGATPATAPEATPPSVKPPTIQPDAVTVIIDAQGQIIDESQIQVIQPENGLDQDLNIEIINQGEAESGVQIGGLQPVVPLDSNVVSPIAPVTPQPLQPEPEQESVQQPIQQPIQQPGQHHQPLFPQDMGQESGFMYPDFNQWPGSGGFHGCGG